MTGILIAKMVMLTKTYTQKRCSSLTTYPSLKTLQDSSEYDCMNEIFVDFEDQEDYSDVEDSAPELGLRFIRRPSTACLDVTN
jgi:hypothetical protein